MRILFIGGDVRMRYAAEKLSESHETAWLGFEENAPNGIFDAIVLPLPLSKDGRTLFAPNEQDPPTFDKLFDIIRTLADRRTLVLAGGENPVLTERCKGLGCRLVNYFANEKLTLQNAALTAEAAVSLLISSTDGALLGSKALITGSGRIAVFLAERLRAFGASVTLAARNPEKRELLRLRGYTAIPIERLSDKVSGFDFIANTIPAPIFGEGAFSQMKKGSVFTELASLPRLPYEDFADKYNVKYIYAGGLPGKYSPKAAGEFIALAVREETERIDANE